MSTAQELMIAESLLLILVIDLEYDYQPVNGFHPIRHQLAWMYAEKILGETETARFVSDCKEEIRLGRNHAVKTNPSKIPVGELPKELSR